MSSQPAHAWRATSDQFKKLGDSEIEFNHYLGIETLMYILSCQTGLHFWLNPKTKQKDRMLFRAPNL